MNYIITVTPLDGSDPWNITTTDNSTSYTVTGLMFGQSYNFTVRANNSIGLGEKSNIITVTLGKIIFVSYLIICNIYITVAIPSAPTNLTSPIVTYQSVSLSWNALSDTGGYNTVNYIITMTPLDGNNPWNITTTDNSTSYTITGLMFGQSYNFTVRANNSIGLGKESNVITVTLPGEGI